MRTNIDLDDNLVEAAFQYAHVSTKRDLVNLALREFVQTHARPDIRDLVGKIKIRENYDYKKLRIEEK